MFRITKGQKRPQKQVASPCCSSFLCFLSCASSLEKKAQQAKQANQPSRLRAHTEPSPVHTLFLAVCLFFVFSRFLSLPQLRSITLPYSLALSPRHTHGHELTHTHTGSTLVPQRRLRVGQVSETTASGQLACLDTAVVFPLSLSLYSTCFYLICWLSVGRDYWPCAAVCMQFSF